jgi:hypothetical protein
LYQLSASVTFQNTSDAGTEIGLQILANGTAVESRLLSFAPNSNTYQKSLTIEDNLSLTAGELIQVQADAATGSAQLSDGPQELRLVQFNDIPGSGPRVAFSTATSSSTAALTANTFSNVPGLSTTVTSGGLYHVSAAVSFSNTSSTTGTEVGLELLANGIVVESRVLSFAANSPTFQESLDIDDDLSLTANELIQVQAATFGGSATFSIAEGPQYLRIIQFNEIPGAGASVAFTTESSNSTAALTSGAFADISGLNTNVTNAGLYHLSANVTFQNTSPATGTEVTLQILANGQVVESRVLSFAPNSNTFQQSLDVEDNLSLSAGELVQVQATAFAGSAQLGDGPQDLRITQYLDPTALGQISGGVFNDVNLNGSQDNGEPGLAGQTVYLDLNNSGILAPNDPTETTDANGAYSFTGLAPGTYIVRQVQLGGVLFSTGASYTVTIGSGTDVTDKDFGDVLTSIAVPLTLTPNTAFPAQGNANDDYVEAIYRAVLDRNADPGGLSSWSTFLNNGGTRLVVVQGIWDSSEHFTQEVTAIYQTLLGRAPDPQGLAGWVPALESGMSEEQVVSAFLTSPEYINQGDKHFVDAMYESLLGRDFDLAGEAYWLGQLGDNAAGNPTGSPPTLTHAQVVTDFLYSTESLQRLVEGYYEVFLQRQADTGGLNSWVPELQQGLRFRTIGEEFVASDEFYNNAAGKK